MSSYSFSNEAYQYNVANPMQQLLGTVLQNLQAEELFDRLNSILPER